MHIRPAQQADINQLAVITVDTWRSAYTGIVDQQYLDSMSYERCRESWHTRLLDEGITMVAVDDAGDIMGYAQAGPSQRAEEQFRRRYTPSMCCIHASAWGLVGSFLMRFGLG